MKRFVSILMVITILILLMCSCSKKINTEDPFESYDQMFSEASNGTTTVTVDEAGSEVITVTDANGSVISSEVVTKNSATVTTITDFTGTTVAMSQKNILALYTEVMNKAKSSKVGFKKIEWQEVPSGSSYRKVSKGAAVYSTLLTVANGFITNQNDAETSPKVYAKGSNMAAFPVRNSSCGCTLTDTSAISSISCQKSGNLYKITLVLKSETLPADSSKATNYGKVCAAVSRSDIDKALQRKSITSVCSNINYSLTTHDVTSTVIFDSSTKQIVALKQVSNVTLSGSACVYSTAVVVDKQEIIDTSEFVDIIY